MENAKLNLEKDPCSKHSNRTISKVNTDPIAGPSWLDNSSKPSEAGDIESITSDFNLSLELKERLSLTQSTSTQEFVDSSINLVNGSSSFSDSSNGSLKINNYDELNNSTFNCEELKNQSAIEYVQYESELQMPLIMKIIQKDLSEPYSIYTYRYFIHNWPKLCFLAMCESKCVGAIVCKLDMHRKVTSRGYIAMLAVDQDYRKRSIGSTLVKRAIREMIKGGADEVVLETEVTNKPALRLYEALGFVRDKRLFRYYLNGVDALRLKLWLR